MSSAARRLKRASVKAERKAYREKHGNVVHGMQVGQKDDPMYCAILYLLANHKKGEAILLDLGAWRPGKVAAFWRAVEMFKDADMDALRDKPQEVMRAARASQGGAQVGAEAPRANLRI